MRKIILLPIFLLYLSCSREPSGVSLINFKTYEVELDVFKYGDGLKGNYVLVKKQKGNNVNIAITFNQEGVFLSPAIEGAYNLKNDTIFLTWKYNEDKEEFPNASHYGKYTMVWEYDFKVDTIYDFIFLLESNNNSNIDHQ